MNDRYRTVAECVPVGLMVLLSGLLLVDAVSAESWKINGRPCVNLRQEPNMEATAIRCLPFDTEVESISARGGWLQVSVDEVQGWVFARYLKPSAVREPEKTPAKQPPAAIQPDASPPSATQPSAAPPNRTPSAARRLQSELELARDELETFQALAIQAENDAQQQLESSDAAAQAAQAERDRAIAERDRLAENLANIERSMSELRERVDTAEAELASPPAKPAGRTESGDATTKGEPAEVPSQEVGALRDAVAAVGAQAGELERGISRLAEDQADLGARLGDVSRLQEELKQLQERTTSEFAQLRTVAETLAERLERFEGAVPDPSLGDAKAAVESWAEAWSARDVERYLGAYSERFRPVGTSRTAWESVRRQRLRAPETIAVELSGLTALAAGSGSVSVEFVQSYRSNVFADVVRKRLVLSAEDGGWRIIDERVLESNAALPGQG